MEEETIQFAGWGGPSSIYGFFNILNYDHRIKSIIVAHEGHWIDEDGMFCHSDFQHYEDVQKSLGKGLSFVAKEYSNILRRSLFKFDILSDTAVLAVPATGEEIYFDIYGIDEIGNWNLLIKQEL